MQPMRTAMEVDMIIANWRFSISMELNSAATDSYAEAFAGSETTTGSPLMMADMRSKGEEEDDMAEKEKKKKISLRLV